MAYTQTEYLAGFLAVSCLVLLYCWHQKKQEVDRYERMTVKHALPGLHFRDGLRNPDGNDEHIPGLRMNKGYVRPGLEGLDNGSPGNLNDAAHVGNLAGQMSANAYRVPPMVEAKWNVDSEIQIPRLAATDADVDRQMLEWGGELPGVDAKAISQCDMHSVSLGGEILAKTDYEPEYGSAKGEVTY